MAEDVDVDVDGSRRAPSRWDHGVVLDPGQVKLLMRDLVDRGLPQDVIDVRAACRYYSVIELEQPQQPQQPGAGNEGESDLVELRDRLESVVWVSDEEFAAHGLGPEEIAELRRWALDWESDLGLRLAEEYDDPAGADD